MLPPSPPTGGSTTGGRADRRLDRRAGARRLLGTGALGAGHRGRRRPRRRRRRRARRRSSAGADQRAPLVRGRWPSPRWARPRCSPSTRDHRPRASLLRDAARDRRHARRGPTRGPGRSRACATPTPSARGAPRGRRRCSTTRRTLDDGLRLLGWLLDTETSGRPPVGHPGRWLGAGEPRPGFDQQPIEVAALADACARAYDVTGDRALERGRRSAARPGSSAPTTPGPPATTRHRRRLRRLQRDGRNENQGAESTLAMISTLQQAQRLLRRDSMTATALLRHGRPSAAARPQPGDRQAVPARAGEPGRGMSRAEPGHRSGAGARPTTRSTPTLADGRRVVRRAGTPISPATFDEHFDLVAHRIHPPRRLSPPTGALVGAYFTQEYSIEAAALFNPSIVPAPGPERARAGRAAIRDERAGRRRRTRLDDRVPHRRSSAPTATLTLRPPGDPTLAPDAAAPPRRRRDALPPEPRRTTATRRPRSRARPPARPVHAGRARRRSSQRCSDRLGTRGQRPSTIDRIRRLMARNYDVDVPRRDDLSERVLSRPPRTRATGMEDARFIRFVEDDGSVDLLRDLHRVRRLSIAAAADPDRGLPDVLACAS